MAIPVGYFIEADVARPPSPLYGWKSLGNTAVPATVVIMPVLAVTFRMR